MCMYIYMHMYNIYVMYTYMYIYKSQCTHVYYGFFMGHVNDMNNVFLPIPSTSPPVAGLSTSMPALCHKK